MGEAAEKKKLGPMRRIVVTRSEKIDLVNFLIAPVRSPNGGVHFRGTANRSERKQLRSALEQLGCIEAWRQARAAIEDGKQQEPPKLPKLQVQEVSVDAINFVLDKVLTDMPNSDGLALYDLEQRLDEAKDGKYELDAHMAELGMAPEGADGGGPVAPETPAPPPP